MLYKRGGTYWIDFKGPLGQRVRKSAGTTDKAQAQEFHDRLKADLWRQSRLGERPSYTWEDAALRWTQERSYKKSFRDDLQRLEWFHRHLHGKLLEDIDRKSVMALVEIKRKETCAATANRYLALIRAILRACVEWDWLDQAPSFRQFQEAKRRVRWLTVEESQRLLAELPEHLRDMAAFSLATGLRESNVTGLKWNQLDLSRRVAWIHADETKNKQALGVSLGSVAVEIIRRQIGKNQEWVFTYEGKPVGRANNHAWRKALKRAGIENFRWHDLRHTWASWHVQAGTSIGRLQEMGGWESVEMVRRYAHLAPQHLLEDAGKIDEVLSAVYGTKMAQPLFLAVPDTA